MVRVGGLVWFLMMGVWIYALLDVITTDSSLVRNLSKMTWVFIVFIGSFIGAIIWFIAGRPEKAGFKPGDTTYRKPISFRAPDDDPDFLRDLDRKRKHNHQDDADTLAESAAGSMIEIAGAPSA